MRKEILVITTLLCLLCATQCRWTKVYVLGIDANQAISDMATESAEEVLLGAIASVATHLAGHYIAAELVSGDLKQRGIREITLNPWELSASDYRWIARGGFVAQTLVNTVLTSCRATRDSYFTRGFTLGTMLEIGTYPVGWSSEGDLHYLEAYGGNPDLEWGLYTGLSLYNFYIINTTNGKGVLE